MSYQIGLDALHCRPTPRVAHTEYCDHDELARVVTGRDDAGGFTGLIEPWQFDIVWSTDDGPINWHEAGRATSMGHAAYDEGGSDYNDHVECPFSDPEQVLAFDAVEEYGLPDFDALVDHYEARHQSQKRRLGDVVVPGGYYKSIVSGAIAAFGWDMLLMGAAEPKRFERVLDSFFRRTLYHAKAWAKTSIEVFIQHDDMVWTSGPFMNPDIYREVIFPRYAELWKPLHDAGKKVLYCSDGDWSMFLDDIAEAGADGFIFEPVVPFELVVEKYGGRKALLGSKVDCRTMTFGTLDDVRREIDETLDIAGDVDGFVFAVGNHIPSNVPVETALGYFEHLRARWHRPHSS